MSRQRTRVLSLLNHYQAIDSQQLLTKNEPSKEARDKFNKFIHFKRGKTDDFKQYLNRDDKKSKSLSIARTISRNQIVQQRSELIPGVTSPASTHSSSTFHPMLPHKNKPTQFVVNLIKRSYINNNRRIKIVIAKNKNKFQEQQQQTIKSQQKSEIKEGMKCQSSNLLAATNSGPFNFSLLKKLNHEKQKSFYNDAINTIYNELIRQKTEAIEKMQREQMPDELGINKIVVKKRIALEKQRAVKDMQIKKLQRTKTCDKDVRTYIGNKCVNPESFKYGIKETPTRSILRKIEKRKQNKMKISDVQNMRDFKFFNDEVIERVCPWEIGSSRNNDQF